MRTFDTIVRGGRVVTASDTVACDVGIRDGKIVALGDDLGAADAVIDARGRLVLPDPASSWPMTSPAARALQRSAATRW
jgi:dihydroorotase-like cyclic amidohydrolase